MNRKLNLLAFAMSSMLVGGAMDILADGTNEPDVPTGETVLAEEHGTEKNGEEKQQQEREEAVEDSDGLADDEMPAALAEGEQQALNTFSVSTWDEFKTAANEINAANDQTAQYFIEVKNDILDMPEFTYDDQLYAPDKSDTVVFSSGTTTIYGTGQTIGCHGDCRYEYFRVENGAVLNLGFAEETKKSQLNISGFREKGGTGYTMIVVKDGATLNIYDGTTITERKEDKKNLDDKYQSHGCAIHAYTETGQETTVNMYGGTISNCYNENGAAGVSMGENTVFTLYNGTIENNECPYSKGAGISSEGSVNIKGGTIRNNVADSAAGVNVFRDKGNPDLILKFNMTGGVIENNIATYYAGGVEFQGDELKNVHFTYTGGVIQNNYGEDDSSDICIYMFKTEAHCTITAPANKDSGFGTLIVNGKDTGKYIDNWYWDMEMEDNSQDDEDYEDPYEDPYKDPDEDPDENPDEEQKEDLDEYLYNHRWIEGDRPYVLGEFTLGDEDWDEGVYLSLKAAFGYHITYDLKGGKWEERPDSFMEDGDHYFTAKSLGDKLDAVPEPTEPHGKFVGWQTADGNPFDFDTPVDHDFVLYAKWEYTPISEVPLNIQYDAEYEGTSLDMAGFDPTTTIEITPINGAQPFDDNGVFKIVPTESNTPAGIVFPTYEQAGDYWYKVSQKEGNVAGVDYDNSIHYMHVVVKDTDGKGDLKVVAVYFHSEVLEDSHTDEGVPHTSVFANTYGSGELTVKVQEEEAAARDVSAYEVRVEFQSPAKTVKADIVYDSGKIAGNWSGFKAVTLVIKAGESVTFTGIPAGVTYSVSTKDLSEDGYEIPVYSFGETAEKEDVIHIGASWDANNATGSIGDVRDILVITNRKKAIVPDEPVDTPVDEPVDTPVDEPVVEPDKPVVEQPAEEDVPSVYAAAMPVLTGQKSELQTPGGREASLADEEETGVYAGVAVPGLALGISGLTLKRRNKKKSGK